MLSNGVNEIDAMNVMKSSGICLMIQTIIFTDSCELFGIWIVGLFCISCGLP